MVSHPTFKPSKKKDPQRIKKSDKEYVDKLDYSEIEFPVTIKQFNKIEKNNNININIFGYEDKQPYPVYISEEKYEDHIELLLITKDETKHYVLIKDFIKFMFIKRSMSIGNTSACTVYSASVLKKYYIVIKRIAFE